MDKHSEKSNIKHQISKLRNRSSVAMTSFIFDFWILIFAFVLAAGLIGGCVERKLTIDTNPRGAIISLNDQQIGESPVTVPFNWYGDFSVRITKDGYETLDTHRKLKAPLHDCPPFDFVAEILYPGRIVDSYEWTFDLSPKQYPTRDKLIQQADALRDKVR